MSLLRAAFTGWLLLAGVALPTTVQLQRAQPRIGPSVPLVRSAAATAFVAVPRIVGADVVLEVFDPGPDFDPISSASDTHAFAWSKDGIRLKLIAR